MKKLGMVLAGVAVVMLSFTVVMAAKGDGGAKGGAKAGGKNKAAKTAGAAAGLPTEIPQVSIALEDTLATMTKELKLEDVQRARMKARIDGAIAAVAKWDQQNASAQATAQQELDKAKALNDADAVTKGNQKIKDLQAEREKLMADKQADILEGLTPEQKNTWEGYKLYNGLLLAFSRVVLTGQQQEQMRALTNDGAAQVAKADNPATKAQARRDLLTKAIALLTDQQKKDLTGKADNKTKGDRKGKAKAGGRGGK